MAFKFEMTSMQIKNTINVINELQTKFPMLEIEDVYAMFDGITAQTKVTKNHFNAIILLMHWLNNNGAVIDLLEIKKMKIKKNQKVWSFYLKSINNHELKFKCESHLED